MAFSRDGFVEVLACGVCKHDAVKGVPESDDCLFEVVEGEHMVIVGGLDDGAAFEFDESLRH